jgi:hypothetical protein
MGGTVAMTSSAKQAFADSAAAPRRKRPAPFSIRLSEDERAYLERKAGNKPLGTYARDKLLGDTQTSRKTPPRKQSMDYEMLGRVLAMLGDSELATSLCMLALAAENGSLNVTDEMAETINDAHEDIQEIRLILIRALGLRP